MFNWKIAGIVVICAGALLYYLGYFEKPEDRVEEFIEAVNDQDVRKMMEMVDNSEVDQIKSGLNILGSVSDAVLGIDFADLLLDFLPLSDSVLGSEGLNMYIEDIRSVDMDLLRTEATVVAEVEVEDESGNEFEMWEVELEKQDHDWIITDIIELDNQ